MIRKSGIFIFAALLSLVLVLGYFFSGSIIRSGLVGGIEQVSGAEVNISKVALSLSPLGIVIHDLEVTDKSEPSLNLVSLELMRADLELWPALMGYYVISDLRVTGLDYKSVRRSPGKVYVSDESDLKGEANGASAKNLSDVLKLDLPSAEELFDRLDLQVVAKGTALKAKSVEQAQALKDIKSNLPSKALLVKLQNDIKALTDSKVSSAAGLANKTKQLKKLKKQVKQEAASIANIKRQLSVSREELGTAIAELKQAKEEDWNKLQSLANIKGGGLVKISQLLLGDSLSERIAQLQSAYQWVKPYLPSGSDAVEEAGTQKVLVSRILPLSNKPYPNFWVKSAGINWKLSGGEVDIQLQDITTEHTVIQRATQFQLAASGLNNLEMLSAEGDFAVYQQLMSNMSWTVKQYNLEPGAVAGAKSLSMANGILDSKGTIKLVGSELEQQADMVLGGAQFKSSKTGAMDKLTKVLNQQASIPFTVTMDGDISRPSVSVRSKLDSIVGDAILSEAKQKSKALAQNMRTKLDQMLKEQLKGQGDWLSKLDSQDSIVAELEGIVNNSLKAELKGFKGEAKKKLKDKLLKFGR